MADEGADLDDVRYEHHLKHRGQFNRHLAQIFWLVICAAIAGRIAYRLFVWWQWRRNSKHASRENLSMLFKYAEHIAAFVTAISLRSLPRISIIPPVSVGRLVTIIAYTVVIIALLLSVNAPSFSAHFLDDVAFRAAWVTVTQVPLVYFLSTKRGPLNFLTGISYERINWIHRWVGRSLFICATMHMSIMMSSISVTELMKSPDKAMAVVRYGVGAYGMLSWIVISSILPLRRWSYRLFYANHCVCTLAFLWIISRHVPTYARFPIYASFTLIVVDKSLCSYKFLWNNVSIRPLRRKFSKFRKGPSRQVLAMGHPVKMTMSFMTASHVSATESTTVIRICDVPFAWRPGQHVRIYLPKLGPFEVHPFTPATCADISSSPFPPSKNDDVENNGLLSSSSSGSMNDMTFMIKAHSGLTKRLSDYQAQWLSLPCPNASRPSSSLTAFFDGPYGNTPAWEDCESIILIATSTGVSFSLSIMDYLEQLCFEGQARLRTKQIHFIWVNRHIEPQFEATVTDLLLRHSTMLRESDIKVEAEFYVTCAESECGTEPDMREYDPFAHLRRPRRNYFADRPPLRIRNPNALDEEEDEDEMEDLGELKHIEPCVSEMESRSSCETYVSSTLINEDESVVSELESTLEELETSCWSRMPSIRLPRFSSRVNAPAFCQCALARQQETKSRSRKDPDFVTKCYGTRPDIPSILAVSTTQNSPGKTMVAVCSNSAVTVQAKDTVSRLNMEFARGGRERPVEIYTEGFA